MQQLSLFDAIRRPPIILLVDPDGPVVKDDPDYTFRLKHPRLAWDQARIEIHQHRDGLWMWSSSHCTGAHGGGYRVGEKWGNFAETREDALFYACSEIDRRMEGDDSREASVIRKWASTLKDNGRAFQ